MTIDIAHAAVIAVHLQNDIVQPDGAFGPFFAASASERGIVEKGAAVLEAARAASLPVYYTRVGWDAGHETLVTNSPLMSIVAEHKCLVNGTWQTEILEAVRPGDRDIVLTNERVSGFAGSILEQLLRDQGIKTVVIFGVATNVSVESTVRSAADLGFNVVLVEDASSAATQEIHDATIQSLVLLATIATSQELIADLAVSV
ncbi:isochorismatase family cysteine hydrolase [Microbacterium pumilum]|uniref:Isochorismatase-like domain-containing protein n=1 Tax=Microbacterium pumilum TaxID=344165 RepID=A0ABP5EID9_9MICO